MHWRFLSGQNWLFLSDPEWLFQPGANTEKENCYKMMLLTGSKKQETLRFYEKNGYNSSDKTAFIQWLGMDK